MDKVMWFIFIMAIVMLVVMVKVADVQDEVLGLEWVG